MEYRTPIRTLSPVTENENEAIVEALYAPLYRFALSLTGNPVEACDLTQEAFFRWLKHQDSVRDPSKAKSWLFTTLHREFLALVRRSSRYPHRELEEVEAELPWIEPQDVNRMDGAIVMQALHEVEETHRAPLSLFYLESYSYQQIAVTLDMPIGTVMSRLSRGRDQLRRNLRQLMSAEDRKIIPLPRSA